MSIATRTSMTCALVAALSFGAAARAADLRIGLMQAQAGDARKYQALVQYLAAKGVPASFVTAPDYRAAADMFAAGKLDVMFTGSGLGATLIIKGLADPLVRPTTAEGLPSYAAVVIVPRGAPAFDGSARYFDGKRVIFTPLASAGEFYFRSLGPSRPAATLKAASHGAALDALGRGQADVAVLKNHVWTKEQSKFPGLALVGGDKGENPDNTLIASTKLDPAAAKRLTDVLLGVERDPAASPARQALGIKGFVPASVKDFTHTIDLLKKAGVTKDFSFEF